MNDTADPGDEVVPDDGFALALFDSDQLPRLPQPRPGRPPWEADVEAIRPFGDVFHWARLFDDGWARGEIEFVARIYADPEEGHEADFCRRHPEPEKVLGLISRSWYCQAL